MVGTLTDQFAFAGKVKNQTDPIACWVRLQDGKPFSHFAYLLHAIEETIHTGQAAYPVERTLMSTGVLDRVMHSLADNNQLYQTPELNFPYQPANWPFANHPESSLKLDIF